MHPPLVRALFRCLILIALPGVAAAQPKFTRIPGGDIASDSSDSNGAAFVDYDNDGDEDLFVAAVPFRRMYRNDGKGAFTRITTGELVNIRQASNGVSWADFDNDGNADVFLANGVSRIGSLIYRGDGRGDFFRNEQWSGPNDVVLSWAGTWGDYDNDGFVDLVAVHAFGFLGTPASRNWMFRNNGDGSFAQLSNSPIVTTGVGPYTVPSWSDFDQDGDIDLFIGSGPANGTRAPDFLYRNMLKESGKATFQRMTESPLATDSLDGQVWGWADYDNDGDLDAYVTNYGAPTGMRNHLYRNDAGKFVRDTTAGPIVTDTDVSLGSTWGDFDNDGDLDVFVTNGGFRPANKLYINQGNGTFSTLDAGELTAQSVPSWGSALADIDGDGDLDLFVSNKQIPARGPNNPARFFRDGLYRNDLAGSNHWLELTLVGTTSNRAGIGARVRATATIGGKRVTQLREVSTQNTFNGHSSVRVHFGFGGATVAESIEIFWPSGTVDRHANVALDRIAVATEGKGLTAR